MIHANITTETERRMAGYAEPEFECAGCNSPAWTPEEMPKCITCGKRFCADCLVSIGGEKFCIEHARCKCGQPAIVSCDDCGDLCCAAHLAERCDPDRTRDLCFPMCAVRTPGSPERRAMIAECMQGHKDAPAGCNVPGSLPDRPGPRAERKPASSESPAVQITRSK